MKEPSEDEVVVGSAPITTIIQRIKKLGKTQKIAVSKTYNTANGNIFTSRTESFTEVVDGVEVGGLTNVEASIAAQMVSLQVDKDSIYRAQVSGYIDESTRDRYLQDTTSRHKEAILTIHQRSSK
jgi:hypothetical protein